ncbi:MULTISPECIES: hypothetical protein [Polaromonas]|uniref:Abortive infection protein-like C-terminal domain-containing protein n=1 Tax=Polaromonas aquatica TaxID=332657 RepID=A0ABW1TZC8_9BURK
MTKKQDIQISTLTALKERHFSALQRFGITDRATELLAVISTEWVQGSKIAAAEFRRDHRRDGHLLRWLEERRFIASDGRSPYIPEFNAFCVMLAARKRIALSLFKDMKLIIGRALDLLHHEPLRTQVRLDEFASQLQTSPYTLPALKLLGTSSLGIYVSTDSGVQLVQFSEETLKGKKLLGYVSAHLEMLTRSGSGIFGPPDNTGQGLNTFSIDKLLLVEDAYEKAGRALSQLNSAPDGAISSAKSALEATLKYIAHTENLEMHGGITIPQLLKLCKPFCGLGSDPSHKMSRSIASLCTEIAEARNILGDSHGKAPGALAPTRAESRFIVGVTLHLSDCLLERYEAHRMTSHKSR